MYLFLSIVVSLPQKLIVSYFQFEKMIEILLYFDLHLDYSISQLDRNFKEIYLPHKQIVYIYYKIHETH